MKRSAIIKLIIGLALGTAFGNWIYEAIQSPNIYYVFMVVLSLVAMICNIIYEIKEK